MITYPDYYSANYEYEDEEYEGRDGVLWSNISQDIWGRPDLAYILIEHNPGLSDDSKIGYGLAENYNLKIPLIDLATFPTYNTPDWRQAAELGGEI